ncbi:amidohydrolase family protein [Microbispora sp. NEAU-D428]|uniref:amidohydrolase family protein n=1 Tax=Microbispora sitophila TaxID=2771537 RepID=UPI0018668CA4|nr:amidohydrolase family protein [Microbispora sitophila]MBE3010459.1 amidohydrolase family protein [Microbispora sitophila]
MRNHDISPGITTISNVRIFDGVQLLDADSVILRDGLIDAVGHGLDADGESFDGRGATLIPGLIDAHTHAFPGRLEQALAFGVTTELDMFADPAAMADLKRQAAQRADMADILSAGTGATAPGGHPRGIYPDFPTIDRPDRAEEFADARAREGSDYLKVVIDDGSARHARLPALSAATVSALTVAAHARGMLVVAHAVDQAAARTAAECGVDGLAHLFVDSAPVGDFAFGGFVIPTLCALLGMWGDGADAAALAEDPSIAPWLDATSHAMLTAGGFAPPGLPPRPRHELDVLARLREAGVRVLAGTDASCPTTAHGASLHHELALLVAAGLTPAEALAAATAGPAEVFELADRGRIEAGRRADLVLLDGDPLTDITATRRITAIWRGGHAFDREAARTGT